MFYDNFKKYCDIRGVTPTKVALACGLSNAAPSGWKRRGTTPKADVVAQLARYLSISTNELLDGVSYEPSSSMTKDQQLLLDAAKGLTTVEVQEVLRYIRFLKNSEREQLPQ